MSKFLELLKKLGIDLGDKAEALKAELVELEKTTTIVPPVVPLKTDESSEKDKTILALQKQLTDVTNLIGEMKKDRDLSVAAQKEKLEQAKVAKIAELKKKGLEAGKITEANWEAKYKNLAEKDVDAFESVLDDLAVDPHFKPNTKPDDKKGATNTGSIPGPFDSADSTILKAINEMNNKD